MKLLLDAHFSQKRIAVPLAKRGHGVFALEEHPEFDGVVDAQVFEIAVEQRRILVTSNAKDFAPLLRTWAEGDLHHHGVMPLWTMRLADYGQIPQTGCIGDPPRSSSRRRIYNGAPQATRKASKRMWGIPRRPHAVMMEHFVGRSRTSSDTTVARWPSSMRHRARAST